jgi:hypothetical protein
MVRLNRYFRFAKISEAQFRHLLGSFALDLTATQTSAVTGCRFVAHRKSFWKRPRSLRGGRARRILYPLRCYRLEQEEVTISRGKKHTAEQVVNLLRQVPGHPISRIEDFCHGPRPKPSTRKPTRGMQEHRRRWLKLPRHARPSRRIGHGATAPTPQPLRCTRLHRRHLHRRSQRASEKLPVKEVASALIQIVSTNKIVDTNTYFRPKAIRPQRRTYTTTACWRR